MALKQVSSPMKKMTDSPEWQALVAHQASIAGQRMQDWFAQDPLRFDNFSLGVDEIFLDYSKNRVTAETIRLLCQLAKSAGLDNRIEALFSGQAVNYSEDRPALHTALRDQSNAAFTLNGQNIRQDIDAAMSRLATFVTAVRAGKWLGSTGKPVRDIINIGIGGSHLGPMLTVTALQHYAQKNLRCHFISNIDAAHLEEILTAIDPEQSLFIISSKSFTTLETTTNADTIRDWLRARIPGGNIAPHFVAITAAKQKAEAFGIPAAQIFPLWEWVGGRYSIWSAVGLPLALCIGMENFLEFQRGAYTMDRHFREAEFSHNMPVLLGLLGVWYINFFGANNHAIVPYSHLLLHLRTYLQQADMESNGKNISRDGSTIAYATGPIIWGEQGCNAQHAFHQLLHQGQHFIPVDFILAGSAGMQFDGMQFNLHQDILVSSGLSQAQALLRGKSHAEALQELLAAGVEPRAAETLARHKTISGNRPSNIIFMDRITPHSLGKLLALYEHKIFVQGAIWDINSFDQWGVELGKQLLPQILASLHNPELQHLHESSTHGLIQHYKKIKA
jgi:glucose-6-phosphate isomerase